MPSDHREGDLMVAMEARHEKKLAAMMHPLIKLRRMADKCRCELDLRDACIHGILE